MLSGKYKIMNELGLHARPANTFVKQCMGYTCDIRIVTAGREYNAKSILQVLTAGIRRGTEIKIICSGDDEDAAMAGISGLLENGLER